MENKMEANSIIGFYRGYTTYFIKFWWDPLLQSFLLLL